LPLAATKALLGTLPQDKISNKVDIALTMETRLEPLGPLLQLPRLTSLKLRVDDGKPGFLEVAFPHILADGIKNVAQTLEHLHLILAVVPIHVQLILAHVSHSFAEGANGRPKLRTLQLEGTDGCFIGRSYSTEEFGQALAVLEEFSWIDKDLSYASVWDTFRTNGVRLKRISLINSRGIKEPIYRVLSPTFLSYLKSYTSLVELRIPIRRPSYDSPGHPFGNLITSILEILATHHQQTLRSLTIDIRLAFDNTHSNDLALLLESAIFTGTLRALEEFGLVFQGGIVHLDLVKPFRLRNCKRQA
jgi:hypothetical protein